MLVTGASSGVGRAVACFGASRDWNVVLAGRSEEAVESVARELVGKPVAAVVADVRTWSDQEGMTRAALARFGRLDAVVTSAGVSVPEGLMSGTPDQWQALVDTNLRGTAMTVRATLLELTRSGGHYVLMGSVAGRVVMRGWMYSAVKHGVTALAGAFRAEVEEDGVRVTIVQPGLVNTPLLAVAGRPAPPGKRPPPPASVAELILQALDAPSHPVVNEIVVRPAFQPSLVERGGDIG